MNILAIYSKLGVLEAKEPKDPKEPVEKLGFRFIVYVDGLQFQPRLLIQFAFMLHVTKFQ